MSRDKKQLQCWWFVATGENTLRVWRHGTNWAREIGDAPTSLKKSMKSTSAANNDNTQIVVLSTGKVMVLWGDTQRVSNYPDVPTLLAALALRGVKIPEQGPWHD